ncbi:MAG: hypothetical protein AAFY27_07510, partial [Pseudomonadota bacterium]
MSFVMNKTSSSHLASRGVARALSRPDMIIAAVALAFGTTTLATETQAQGAIAAPGPSSTTDATGRMLSAGDAVVSGFSGVRPSDTSGGGSDLIINLRGPSAQILSLSGLSRRLRGQLSTPTAKHRITAGQVGQVFGVAIDNARTPNIYLAATSLYGLYAVEAGGGERLEIGEPGATFMPGQFGPGGNGGTIYKVDGRTGEVTIFANLPNNSGAGVGNVTFDPKTGHLYATDLDSGLIYKISPDGQLTGVFDHGVEGRANAGMSEIGDDGQRIDVESTAFDTNDPSTWGYTQAERRVWGVAVYDGRLYYTVAGTMEVWSVGLDDNGSFADDAQMEFDVKGLAGNGAVTDITFDQQGRAYLAQRGTQKASFTFAEFASPAQSNVVRYQRAGGAWVPAPETYAIGMPPQHHNANGGVALGYAVKDDGKVDTIRCREMLWTTGGRLMTSAEAANGAPDVHGLQGSAVAQVQPANTPPTGSYFLDTDGRVGDSRPAGHMGDVEVFAPCGERATTFLPPETRLPPGFVPPGTTPPPIRPPEFPPPERPFTTNLRLTKTATPASTQIGAGFRCSRFR